MAHRGRAKHRGGGTTGGGGGGGSKHRGGGRGNAGGLGYSGPGNRFVRPEPYSQTGIVDGRPFTLWDEAQNTEKHHGATSNRLRDMKISFVSAGSLEPSELLKPMVREPRDDKEVDDDEEDDNEDSAGTDLDEEQDSPVGEPDPAEEETIVRELDMSTLQLHLKSSKPSQQEELPPRIKEEQRNRRGFVLDLTSDPSLAPKQNAPVQYHSRTSSPASSDSERIVFIPKGKKGSTVPTPKSVRPESPPPKKNETSSYATRDRIIQVVTTEETIITHLSSKSEEAGITKTISPTEPVSQFNGQRSTSGNKRRGQRRRKQDDGERAALEDYLENIAAQARAEAAGDDSGATSRAINQLQDRDLGGDEWVDESSTDEEDAALDSDAVRRYKNGGWSEYELQDFDDLSTDEEGVRGLVDTILRIRKRPSGLQYLIKWDGYDTGDATWVLHEKMDSSTDAQIKLYEESITLRVEDSEDSGSDGAMEVDEDSDFLLAQRLQRHEELGIGMDVDLDDLDEEIMGLNDGFFPMAVGKRRRGKRGKKGQNFPDLPDHRAGVFPSASGLADAYDSFDVLDRERPSIAKPRKKGKGKLAPELNNLSDEGLAAKLTSTWSRDREKKKLRKIQREELRSQGLLGKRARETGKPNLSDKYNDRMTMTQVFEEIKAFMLKDHESLALPPMDARDRKRVHELANKLNLKSKSVGRGKKRFPTLIKTQRSTLFEGDEEGIDVILRHRTFLRRMDVRSGGAGGRKGGGGGGRKGGGGGGGGPSGARRRDGEVVGADAPELGLDNRGRIMLEKMGYKAGMSLGTEHNKGIVVPVVAVVKVSKAGLG